MKLSTTFSACLIGLFIFSATTEAGAQVKQTPQQRQDLLKKVLREKHFHLPGTEGEEATERDVKNKTTATDQRVTTHTSSVEEAEISIAYDPTDSSNLVLSYMEQNSGLVFPIYYSSNGGASWTRSSFSSTGILHADFPGQLAAGGGDPAFAWDKTGRLYYSWIYLSINSTFDTAYFSLNWAYSTDKGHTWSVAPKHFIGQGALDPNSGTSFPYKDGITDREWLAVDNSGGPHQGNVYCSFVNFPADGSAPTCEAIKTMIAGTDSFGAIVPAYVGTTQFGNVEVDNTGVLHMSFADLDNGQVKHAASTNGGVSFGASTVVGAASNMFPGGPFVVHNRENGAINMSCDGPAGTGHNVHIVWSDFPAGTVTSYYAHSTDGGNTWSTRDSLNNHFPGQISFMPTVAAYGNNVSVAVTAVDSSDSASYYLLNSTDNGNTFMAPAQVSSTPTNYVAEGAKASGSNLFFGDYTKSARTGCEVYAAWSDGRNNLGPKVYFARKNFCALGVNEISTVTGAVQLTQLYPNPAQSQITLRLTASKSEAVTLQITDMTGRVLLSQQKTLMVGQQDVTLQLAGLASGAYVLSVQNKGGLVATRNVVKK